MTALNKQALLVPERKRHDWSQSVMRDCDFCSQWSLTVKHENGGCICASCCDAEYTAELKNALESAIGRTESAENNLIDSECHVAELEESLRDKQVLLESAEKRIAELEAKLANPVLLPKTNGYWNEQEKAYEEAITLAKRQVRLAGFRCEGDE